MGFISEIIIEFPGIQKPFLLPDLFIKRIRLYRMGVSSTIKEPDDPRSVSVYESKNKRVLYIYSATVELNIHFVFFGLIVRIDVYKGEYFYILHYYRTNVRV